MTTKRRKERGKNKRKNDEKNTWLQQKAKKSSCFFPRIYNKTLLFGKNKTYALPKLV